MRAATLGWSFALGWRLKHWLPERPSARRLGLSQSLIHSRRYHACVMAGVKHDWW